MSSLSKSLQKFLILIFVATSIILVVMGVTRSKKPIAPVDTGITPVPPVIKADATGTKLVTFTGKTYQTPWGPTSASITVKSGKVVAVTMPQVPNSPPSTYAEPYLVDQALRAGSAKIQGVSGATYTSLAFKSSLESAIAKASAQGTVTASPVNTTTKSTSPSYPRRYRDDNEWDD
jgi:uncharacterized protein with FMN-binding domain